MPIDDNELIAKISSIVDQYDTIIMAQYPNVVGVGVGQKYINCEPTGMPCLTIMVIKKVPECYLSEDEIIAPMFEDVMTDVYETGQILLGGPPDKDDCFYNKPYKNSCKCSKSCNNSCSNNSCSSNPNNGSNLGSYVQKYRPADGGVGAYRVDLSFVATMGCAMKNSENIYILGNNHSFAGSNLAPIGTPIIQPSKLYGGTIADKIATLSNFVKINILTPTTLPRNTVDASISLVGPLSNQEVISKNLVSPGLHNGPKITGTYSPRLRDAIFIIGAKAQFNHGSVLLLNASVTVPFNSSSALFVNQTVSTSMGSGGDSGSLGFNGSNLAFGLLFSGSANVSVFNPINEVLNAFKIDFWNL